jgi:hypothetical protein
MHLPRKSQGFITYIDESGDDGLARVKPIDPEGSSEWSVLSAVVVRAGNENAIGHWQKDILKSFGYPQRIDSPIMFGQYVVTKNKDC